MPRLFAIAVLCALAFTLNLGAQGRGGLHRGGFPARTGAVIATGRTPTVVVGRPAFNVPRHVRPPFAIQPAPFYQPFFWSSPFFPSSVYTAAPYVAPYASVQPTLSDSNQVNELSYEVERLTREVQRLREVEHPQSEPPLEVCPTKHGIQSLAQAPVAFRASESS